MADSDSLASPFKITVNQFGWSDDVHALLRELGEGPAIEGALTVDGHDYWVILEYGSSPRTASPGPHPDDDVVLALPDDIPAAKNHSAWYPIRPRYSKKLVFTDRSGRRRVENVVHHPGILGRGTIRAVVALVERSLLDELEQLAADDTLPDREEIVDVLNRHLMQLLDVVRSVTPEQSALDSLGFVKASISRQEENPDGSHLRDAWGIQPAK